MVEDDIMWQTLNQYYAIIESPYRVCWDGFPDEVVVVVVTGFNCHCQHVVFLLQNKMDFSRVAVAGHSFGGGTSVATLAHDKRFK